MLPSRMAVVSGHVRLVVDDRDARYPVTIDPIVFNSTPLNPSGPNDAFGFSVAIHGNHAIIGAPSREASKGATFVFVKGSGGWTQEAEIVASDGADGDLFGFSVAISGPRWRSARRATARTRRRPRPARHTSSCGASSEETRRREGDQQPFPFRARVR
jgi:hypothetical protein